MDREVAFFVTMTVIAIAGLCKGQYELALACVGAIAGYMSRDLKEAFDDAWRSQ